MKNKNTRFIRFLLFIIATSLILSPFPEKANAQWTPTNGVSGGFIWCITSSSSNLFAGTFGYGIFKSTDNGASWNPCINGLKNTYVFSLTTSGSNIIAGTWLGIYYSSNNGDTWNVGDTVLTASKIVYAVSTLGTTGTVFAGTSYHNASDPKTTFISTNYGITWSSTTTNPQVAGTNVGVYSLIEFGGNLFAGTAGASVFRTVNYGSTWNQMTGGTMGTTQNVYCLSAIGTTKLLAGTYQNGFFWSLDNGATWNPQNTGLPAAPNNTIYNITTIGSNIFVPSFGNVVYMATNGVTLTWTPTTSTGLFNKSVYSIYSLGSTLYAGTWGAGVFISNNNASSWSRSNNGLKDVVVGCLSNNGSTLFAGTLGNGVFFSTNNGDNWAQADNTALADPNINTIMPYSTNIFAGTNNGIYLSGNNGVTWTSSSTGLPANTQINCIIPVSSILFAGSQNNHVYKSTNNGAVWTDLGSPSSGAVTSFATIGINIFLSCIGGNGIFYSLNGGTTWNPSTTGLTNRNVHSLSALGTTNIFAGTERGVFLSTNTGATWSRVSNKSNGMDSVLTVYSIVNDGTNVIAGTFNGVYLTSNMGATWQKKNQGLGADTLFVSLLIYNNNVFAGMWPMIPNNSLVSPLVWKRSIANISIGIKNISTTIPDKFNLMQNYPNPFNPATTIKWSIKEGAFVTLKIFDATGQEVGSYVNEKLNAGVYEANIDASNLSSGVYFYKLQAGNFTDTKKMVLIK